MLLYYTVLLSSPLRLVELETLVLFDWQRGGGGVKGKYSTAVPGGWDPTRNQLPSHRSCIRRTTFR